MIEKGRNAQNKKKFQSIRRLALETIIMRVSIEKKRKALVGLNGSAGCTGLAEIKLKKRGNNNKAS